MAKRKLLEVPDLSITKKTRSRFHGNKIKNGPIPSPAPATGEAIATGTPAPVAKGKAIATSCENNIHVLADTSLTFEATHTLANNMLTFASGLEKLLQDFSQAIHIFLSGLEELARELKMGTAEVLRS
jgi:hypothetical protein